MKNELTKKVESVKSYLKIWKADTDNQIIKNHIASIFNDLCEIENLANGAEQSESNCIKPAVTNRYLFWFEDEGKEGWTFKIEAKDHKEAYDKAYDTHGPQVEGMMYQLI